MIKQILRRILSMTGFEIEDVGAPTAPTSAARLVDIPTFVAGAPTTLDIGDVGSPGVSPNVSRSDHEHPFPAPAFVAPVAGVGSLGVSPFAAREDHEHEGVHSVNLATGDVIVPPFPGYGLIPASVEIGDVGSPGISPFASRSDHEHPMLAPVTVEPVAGVGSLGVSTTAAREDHEHEGVHSVNAATGDVIVSEFPGFGPAPAQIDAGDGADPGLALTASRSDHQHAVNTAVGADLAAVDAGASSGGLSATIPRGDHKHTVTTAAPINVDKSANAAGVATSLSRSDHKHDVSTGVASASSDIGDAAAEGVATTIARSDHQHAFPAPGVAPPAIAAVGVIGVATTPARSDHTHAGQGSIFFWGNDSIAAGADTRYLTPGRGMGTAITTLGPYQTPSPRSGTLRNLFVRHNTAAGNGNSVVYAILLNGVVTAVTVTLVSGAVGQASDLINSIAVVQGDRIELRAVKALSIGAGGLDVEGSVEII